MALHQKAADEIRDLGRPPQQGTRRSIGEGLRGAGWAWWLWEWLCEEVLRNVDKSAVAGLFCESDFPLMEMSENQLVDFLCKLKDDEGLQDKLKGAADLDAVVAIAKEAGFNVSKADLLRHQAKQTIELSDDELEELSGGVRTFYNPVQYTGMDPVKFGGILNKIIFKD